MIVPDPSSAVPIALLLEVAAVSCNHFLAAVLHVENRLLDDLRINVVQLSLDPVLQFGHGVGLRPKGNNKT